MPTDEDPRALSSLLDKIHDIAAKACTHDGIPPDVDDALGKIIALSRYKFGVTGPEKE